MKLCFMFVSLFIYFFCLLGIYLKKLKSDFDDIWHAGISCALLEVIKFLVRSGSYLRSGIWIISRLFTFGWISEKVMDLVTLIKVGGWIRFSTRKQSNFSKVMVKGQGER